MAACKLDLKRVKIPIYELSTKEDHIAPASSVFIGSKLFGGPVRFVMAGSGHIAGVVNPPAKKKYQFWSGAPCGLARRMDGEGCRDAGLMVARLGGLGLRRYPGRELPARDPSAGPLKPDRGCAWVLLVKERALADRSQGNSGSCSSPSVSSKPYIRLKFCSA